MQIRNKKLDTALRGFNLLYECSANFLILSSRFLEIKLKPFQKELHPASSPICTGLSFTRFCSMFKI